MFPFFCKRKSQMMVKCIVQKAQCWKCLLYWFTINSNIFYLVLKIKANIIEIQVFKYTTIFPELYFLSLYPLTCFLLIFKTKLLYFYSYQPIILYNIWSQEITSKYCANLPGCGCDHFQVTSCQKLFPRLSCLNHSENHRTGSQGDS